MVEQVLLEVGEKVSADRLSSKSTEVFITTTHKLAHQQIHDENTKQLQPVAVSIFTHLVRLTFAKVQVLQMLLASPTPEVLP